MSPSTRRPDPDDPSARPSRPGRILTERLLDTLPQAIFWKDRDSVYLGCNAAFAAATGLADPQDIVGMTDHDLPWPREEAEAYLADDREVIESGRPKRGILEPLQLADGRRQWIETSKTPLRGEDGAIIGVIGIFTDVTERLQKDAALREARHMLELVLNNIQVRVFWKDRNLTYLGCNELFARDAGLAHPRDIVGKTDFEMGWRDQAELYRSDDRAVIVSGVPKIGYEEPQTTPAGDRIWLRTSKIPLRDADGEIVGVLGTYEDITASKNAEQEQRELEARMQHAQKLESLGILAGGIAHDFNNLLVAVLGHADLALESAAPDEPTHLHLEEIRTAATRARELTNQMLAYSGKGRFVVERLDLNAVVEEMSHLLEASIPKKVRLQRELAAGLPAVEVDAAQIRQVVMNLVTNAAESIDGEGRISLRTARVRRTTAELADTTEGEDLPAGDYVAFEVEDDGAGMDDETRARLFDPFFTTKFQGRGLGLAAVLGIVRGHRGAIEVRSREGRGSLFRVLLPADPRAVPERLYAAAAGPPADAFSGTVLVVDDEESVRRVAGRMLEHEGFTVLPAADGAEAVAIFAARHPEIRLVLLDMTMPRKDGLETFHELQAIDPTVRVILTSGYNNQESTGDLVEAGLAGFIQKPFTLEDLRRRLREALA